ncbi:MAG: HEAT repeat domain-containing protein [Phycisphaerales bacterium]
MGAWMMRGGTWQMLTLIGGAAALTLVGSGCESVSEDLRSFAEDIAPPSPGEAARDMMDPSDPERRRRGTTLIANAPFGGAEVNVRAYADKVEHEQNAIALAAAVRALGRHGQVEHAQLVASRLTHDSRLVRWEAAKALQRLHDPAVVPALLAVMRNDLEDVDVKIAAAHALGQYPEDRVFQVLISTAALNARDLALNHVAQQSLTTLTGQELGDDPAVWMRWYAKADAPFAQQQAYIYPTYSRNETMIDHLTFWKEEQWETPQQPAGLRPADERSTYSEANEEKQASVNNADG